MRIISFLFAACLSLIAMPSAFAKTDPQPEFIKKVVAQKMNAFMQKNAVPGAAAVLYVNGKAYSYQFGVTNLETRSPVSKFTIFEVGTFTKILTNLLLMQEIDYARMALTDSIVKYIPELPEKFKKISLQQLASQTAGLPADLAQVKSWDDLANYMTQWQAVNPPDRKWLGSNASVGLIGIALENTTQMELNELYTRHILNPLRMQPIGLVVPTKLRFLVATGYDQHNKPVAETDMGIFPASKGIKMSVHDMQKFLSAAIGLPGTPERVFYPMLMTELGYLKVSGRQEGLGWHISPVATPIAQTDMPLNVDEVIFRPIYTPNVLIDKSGTSTGFKTYVAIIPYKKSGIAIMINKVVSTAAIANVGREILYKVT